MRTFLFSNTRSVLVGNSPVVRDGACQLEQRRAAAGDEIFLDRHANIGAGKLPSEIVAVALELLGDGGQENLLDVGHDSKPV